MVIPCSRSDLQAIHQQRQVHLVAGGAVLLAVLLEGLHVVVEDHVRVVQEPADERALAVVHAAAGDEAQQFLLLVQAQIGFDVAADEFLLAGHQKYPSRFFCSMEPA